MKISFVPTIEVLDERLLPGNQASWMPSDIVQAVPKEEIKNKQLLLSSPLDESEIEIGFFRATAQQQDHESLISKKPIHSMARFPVVGQSEISNMVRFERFGRTSDQTGRLYPDTSSSSVSQAVITANSNAQQLYEVISAVGETTRNSFVISNTQSKDEVDSLALLVNQQSTGKTEKDSENPELVSPSNFISNSSEMGTSGCVCHGHIMQLNSVAFSGTEYTTVYKDLGSQAAYPSTQWEDTNHDDRDDRTASNPVNSYPEQGKGYPVSYARNSAMMATVSVNLLYIAPNPNVPCIVDPPPEPHNVYFHGVAKDISQNPPLYYYTQIVNYGDPLDTIPNSVSTFTFSPNLINSVHAWTNMTIAWQMYIGPSVPANNSAGWATFNTSRNDNFITLAKSTADKLFLTLGVR